MPIHPNLPKYARLAEQLRGDIEAGVLQPGDRLPSFTQVKEHYGASKQTLERAHSLLQDEGLIERINGIGTFVAKPQKRARTNVMGVVVATDLYRHPYYTRILHGVHEVAHRENVEILLLHEKSVVEWARADGVLLLSPLEDNLHKVPPIMPHLSVLRPEATVPNVGIDDLQGVQDAARYLLDLGHRRIAYLVAEGHVSDERVRAYRQTLRDADIKAPGDWVRHMMHPYDIKERPFFYQNGRASMQRWLQDGWRDLGCTALLAQNDETAIGAIEVLQEAGLSVPHDVSVVGFDGAANAEFFRPRLTTLEIPLEEIGRKSAEYLLHQIRDEQIDTEIGDMTLPVQLKIGESTAPI